MILSQVGELKLRNHWTHYNQADKFSSIITTKLVNRGYYTMKLVDQANYNLAGESSLCVFSNLAVNLQIESAVQGHGSQW